MEYNGSLCIVYGGIILIELCFRSKEGRVTSISTVSNHCCRFSAIARAIGCLVSAVDAFDRLYAGRVSKPDNLICSGRF